MDHTIDTLLSDMTKLRRELKATEDKKTRDEILAKIEAKKREIADRLQYIK